MAPSSGQALTTPSFVRLFHCLLLSLSSLLSFLLSFLLFCLLCFLGCSLGCFVFSPLSCFLGGFSCFFPPLLASPPCSFPCPCPFCLFYHLFWFLCPFSCYHPLLFSVCFLMQIPPGSRSHTHHSSWRSHSSSTRIHTPQGSEGIP